MTYLQLFLQNYLLECCILLPCFYKKGVARVLTVALLANAVTHPLVVFGFLGVSGLTLAKSLLAAEAFAVGFEAVAYHYTVPVRWWAAIGVSLLANLFSWEIGPRLSYLLFRHGGVW